VEISDLSVCYRRYTRRMQTFKEAAVNFFRGNRYETFWALKNINLTINPGESIGIIGPNGSGKSTLLKTIAGILPAAKGSIETHGRVAPLINLGAGFNNELTGRENILLNGSIMGLSRAEMNDRLERIIEFAGIGDFIDAQLSTYSSGMRARLGFAVVTDVDADILLLDEIFSVGDQEFRAKAGARTEEFFESGRIVVLVSHNLNLVRRLCDRAVYLKHGEMVMQGSAEEVVRAYRDEFLATQRARKAS
jgi:ABC-type polysaccharide/polyol phosphate transport system ATPase subunit